MTPRVGPLLLAVVLACGSTEPREQPPTAPLSVELGISRDTLQVGEAAQATLRAQTSAGLRPALDVSWSVSDPAILGVDPRGVVTGRGIGMASLIARSMGLTASRSIQVFAVPIAGVILVPNSVRLQPGDSLLLAATVVDAAGRPLPRPVRWLSSDERIVEVDSSGRLRARVPGLTLVHAIAEGTYGSVSVRVSGPPGPAASITVAPALLSLSISDTVRLVATTMDKDENIVAPGRERWSSSDSSVARVSSTGHVLALRPGTAVLTCSVDAATTSVPVTVRDPANAVVLRAARPDSATVVGDTMEIYIAFTSQRTVTGGRARFEKIESTLQIERAGNFPPGQPILVGTLDAVLIPYGTRQLIVTAYLADGDSVLASFPFVRGARKDKGGTTLPPRSK
jgi:hypothetical protein